MTQKILLLRSTIPKSKWLISIGNRVGKYYIIVRRILELLAESKALVNLGIAIPEIAQNVLSQVSIHSIILKVHSYINTIMYRSCV